MRTQTENAARVVVIGAGMAGARLAARVPGVTVIGEEAHAPYNRVLLAEVLAGRYEPDVIALPPAEVRRGVRVVRIDRAERRVLCDDGVVVGYERLVLATGSNPVLPPLRGLGHLLPDGVHPFRTLDDCLALRAAVRPGVRAVVIGGGLLGVSAARALAECGAQVVLAQQGEHLMERQLDAEAAGMLRRHLEALGVEVHTECRVRGLRCTDGAAPAVRAVELADGYELEAEITVLACGVRPGPGWPRPPGSRYARASSWTTSCAPRTRTSTPSATAPNTRGRSTGWRAPRSNRPTCWPRCWPGGPRATRGPGP